MKFTGFFFFLGKLCFSLGYWICWTVLYADNPTGVHHSASVEGSVSTLGTGRLSLLV